MRTTFRRLTAVSIGIAAVLVASAGAASAAAAGGPDGEPPALTEAQCAPLALNDLGNGHGVVRLVTAYTNKLIPMRSAAS